MEITSLNNSLIKETAKLKTKKMREETGLFLAEGEHLVKEAKAHGCLKQVFVRKEAADKYDYKDRILISDEIMKKLSDTVSLLDIVGVCYKPKEKEICSNKILILDNIQDPGNLGTLIRTAISFGYKDIIASLDTVDVYNEKVLRSTQGAIFQMNYLRKDLTEFIPELKNRGYKVYGTALENAIELHTYAKEEKMALILGNEGNGMRKEILKLTDSNIFIEIEGFESLNVAVAGAIVMYYFR